MVETQGPSIAAAAHKADNGIEQMTKVRPMSRNPTI
jgi:hypothetical protein